MFFLTILSFGILANIAYATTIFSEAFKAQGLLGSHFGVPGIPASFDYVIIGGGTAGLTVARRLAANASITVAVIEAGDFYQFANGNLSEIPAYASSFTGNNPIAKNPYLDWYMYTEPQPQLGNQVFLYDSGKVIGGTSGRNFLWQIRGTVGTFDKWAAEVGDDSYKFNKILPYFQKSYKFHPADNSKRPQNASAKYNVSDWSSSGGPAHVGYSSWVNPISSWLNVGFKEMGIKELTSLLSGNLMGWAYIALELNPTTQTRSSSEEFLSDALEKTTNLILYKNTLAKKITFKNGVATGVVVESGGLSYNLTANKEVILSAGVLRSPQLLMVSGIGPKAAIKAQGIEVLADRPGVGQNMYDNVLVGPTYEVDVVTHNSLANPNYTAQAVAQYQKDRTGILTNVGGDIAGFERLSPPDISNATYQALTSTYPSDWPHIEYLILDAYFGAGTDSTVGLGNGKQYVAASVGIVSTFSRGNITISSPDTAKNPVISPNWLLDPRDQDIAIAAFKRGRKLFSTTAMKPIVVQEAFPGANITSDAQILEVVKATANSVYNGAGTNKMGKVDDPLAVVDSTFKVIGVKGLRVVDASVFPFLPPGQPSATVYALAEKIADCILGGS
ncbi:versicolorin B synthase [Halenospora varia]|nr:versicolorin B synthase [Halenospora varia]